MTQTKGNDIIQLLNRVIGVQSFEISNFLDDLDKTGATDLEVVDAEEKRFAIMRIIFATTDPGPGRNESARCVNAVIKATTWQYGAENDVWNWPIYVEGLLAKELATNDKFPELRKELLDLVNEYMIQAVPKPSPEPQLFAHVLNSALGSGVFEIGFKAYMFATTCYNHPELNSSQQLDSLLARYVDEVSKTRSKSIALEELIDVRTLRLAACAFAEHALNRERAAGREPDQSSWNAIKIARAYANGKATKEELKDAADAAAARAAERK